VVYLFDRCSHCLAQVIRRTTDCARKAHSSAWCESQRPSAICRQAGFTLIEVLVVLVIIGLIMGLVGPRVLSYLSDSKIKAAGLQIHALSGSLDLYSLDNGRYPTTAEGLAALIEKPATAEQWHGPYLRTNTLPMDPWGRQYVYRAPGQHGEFDIISLGPNGVEGDSGNIANWQQ
jgi:general secretion pathway protein G